MRPIQKLTEDRPFFPIDWAYLKAATLKTLFYADDVKIRWLMALASIGWTIELAASPNTLDRPYYALMRFIAPWWFWALMFLAHGIGGIWRIFERKERVRWALGINGLGVAVWVASTVAQNISAGHAVVSTSLEFFACLFLFGSFVTSGWSSKSTTA